MITKNTIIVTVSTTFFIITPPYKIAPILQNNFHNINLSKYNKKSISILIAPQLSSLMGYQTIQLENHLREPPLTNELIVSYRFSIY